MFIDIDNFKYINDTYGHGTGDKVLVQTAQILSSLVNENISIARFGGDEFVALVSKTTSAEMEKYARLTMSLLGRKMEIDGRTHFLSVSAGIAMYPRQASDFHELIQKADAALHRVKQSGKTRFMFFDESIRRELLHRIELGNGLRTAIDNGEMSVAYQPQIDLGTGKIAGLEALARGTVPAMDR
jgi:diguanylate cyclase (GGDEF)-like protein